MPPFYGQQPATESIDRLDGFVQDHCYLKCPTKSFVLRNGARTSIGEPAKPGKNPVNTRKWTHSPRFVAVPASTSPPRPIPSTVLPETKHNKPTPKCCSDDSKLIQYWTNTFIFFLRRRRRIGCEMRVRATRTDGGSSTEPNPSRPTAGRRLEIAGRRPAILLVFSVSFVM